MILSILIATMPQRAVMLTELTRNIFKQVSKLPEPLTRWVQVITNDSTDLIGKKRNDLLSIAQGKYIVFIDDDDEVATNYVSAILLATIPDPDCIGIEGTMTTNGVGKRTWSISKEHGVWSESGSHYLRTPNHISPVRRELALQAGFPEITHGEDAEYSARLLPLLKTEVMINQPLYHYRYVRQKATPVRMSNEARLAERTRRQQLKSRRK